MKAQTCSTFGFDIVSRLTSFAFVSHKLPLYGRSTLFTIIVFDHAKHSRKTNQGIKKMSGLYPNTE